MTAPAPPLHYRLPLTGTVLVEASAGTGKTYTLERLMARHILWHGRPIETVLAVTFTNAAASDIRARLHDFLLRVHAAGTQPADPDLQQLIALRPPEVDATCWQARLMQALAHIDQAAIHTIHGFCQRLLQDFAIGFGQPMPAAQLLEDDLALRREVCEQFWRHMAQDPLLGPQLSLAPDALAKLLPQLLHAPLKPDRRAPGPAPDFDAAVSALRTAHALHRTQAEQALRQALEAGALNRNSYDFDKIGKWFAELDAFLQSPTADALPDLDKLAYRQINPKKGHSAPDNPLLHALDDWRDFSDRQRQFHRDCELALWHALRDFAAGALTRLKAERGLLGFDDLIAQVHRGLHANGGHDLCAAIRARYPVALIDEFQDTDSRQWQIFETLYHQRPGASLVLIGDPKQAIYGFRGGDIHTYLRVQRQVPASDSLDHNFRSNQNLLDAIDSVFLARGETPFDEQEIMYRRAIAGRTDAPRLWWQGQPADALTLLKPQAGGSRKAQHEAMLAQACAGDIAAWLQAAAAGQATVGVAGAMRALRADDIAVLVNRHEQAACMQQALQAVGIPAVRISQSSLLDSYEAHDLLQILQALSPRHAPRLRASAACSVLLAQAYAAGSAPWPALAHALAARGPLAALQPVLRQAQDALLRCEHGARRLANYQQLLALLQSQFQPGQDPGHAAAWLARQISGVGEAPAEGSRPWLESSRSQVRIMTMHHSKGLEFGMVYLPFATLAGGDGKGPLYRVHEHGQYCHYLKPLTDAQKAQVRQQQDAEQLRLLYVAMTRARFALRCGWSDHKDRSRSALVRLLGESAGEARAQTPLSPIAAFATPASVPPPVSVLPVLPAVPPLWQVHSFSSLHRGGSRLAVAPSPIELLGGDARSPFQGAAFGNALHLVLEHPQAGLWLGHAPTADGHALCEQALRRFGYPLALARAGAADLAMLARACLQAPLPEGLCLRDLPASDMRRELEFDLRLQQAGGEHLLGILHAHGYCRQRAAGGFGARLHGLLNGKIDLLYRQQGRLYVLDYKSNRLPDYRPDSLQASIRDNEYDLQYLLYCVAVHRWQQFRRRDYDIRQHFGGVRYLYARGLDADVPGAGLFCDSPGSELIEQLADCFAGARAP